MFYNDPRRFGYLKLLKKNYLLEKPIINLGPDPFSYKFNFKYIKNFIYRKKINIKNLLMNQNFVNIKVDREERPDVDAIYMTAVTSLTGRGGWPMSVFLTPDGKPFFGGTYFP